MPGAYYNTVGHTGPTLLELMDRTNRQESLVLEGFQRENRLLAPHEVSALLHNKYPLTSIRRAITNLTTQGKLIKTAVRRKGSYGDWVRTWTLAVGK